MTMQDNSKCPSYPGCAAPLCPLDQSCLTAVWYPGEQICKSVYMRRQHRWIRTQARIARSKKNINPDCYFTVMMLDTVRVIRNNLAGVEPDAHILKTIDNPKGDPVTAWVLARRGKISREPALRKNITVSGNTKPLVSQIPMLK